MINHRVYQNHQWELRLSYICNRNVIHFPKIHIVICFIALSPHVSKANTGHWQTSAVGVYETQFKHVCVAHKVWNFIF